MENRIVRLEIDLAYLQDEVKQLNDIVAAQQQVITRLEKQNEFLAKKVEDLDVESRPNRKPPHY